MGHAPLYLIEGRAASYQAEPEGLLLDVEGDPSSSGGGIDRLESVLDKGGGAMVEGTALGVVGSEVLAHRSGIGPEASGWTEKGEARAGAGGGITVSGAVSMVSVSISGAEAVAWPGCGGAGRSGQSLLRAESESPQFGHLAGGAGQQSKTGLRLPPLGHEGLGHLC